MSRPAWLDDLGDTLISGVAEVDRASAVADFEILKVDTSDFTPEQYAQLRGQFTSVALGRSLAVSLADATGLTAALDDAVTTVQGIIGAPLALLDDIEAQLQPLRDLAQTAWDACRTASTVVRTCRAVEKVAVHAALSGFPAAVGAWAVAVELRMIAEVAVDAAVKVGRAADHALGAVMGIIDSIRRDIFAAQTAVSRFAQDTVRAITFGISDAIVEEAAYSTLFGDLQGAVVAVA